MAVAHRQAGSGPVQKREVAVVKQEGGAGPCEGVGTSPGKKSLQYSEVIAIIGEVPQAMEACTQAPEWS